MHACNYTNECDAHIIAQSKSLAVQYYASAKLKCSLHTKHTMTISRYHETPIRTYVCSYHGNGI